MPEKTDFSTTAQVKVWIHGGKVSSTVLDLEPLIDEVNKGIKKLSEAARK
ncbi:hypothetical protein [Bartonella sp. B17]